MQSLQRKCDLDIYVYCPSRVKTCGKAGAVFKREAGAEVKRECLEHGFVRGNHVFLF